MILTGASFLLIFAKYEKEVGPRNTDHCMREFLSSEKLVRNIAEEVERKPNTGETERTRTVGFIGVTEFSLYTALLS